MRRSDRQMSPEWAWELVKHGEYGILSTMGPDNLPYGIPLSYVVYDNKIYFHSAHDGRKITNLNFCSDVSFVVVGKTQPIYDNNFTTYFESAIVTGKIINIEDEDLKKDILFKLAKKYLPDYMGFAEASIEYSLKRTKIMCIEVETISGKAKLPKNK